MRTGRMSFIWLPEVEDWNASEETIADIASSETYCALESVNCPESMIPHIVLIESVLCVSFAQLLVFGAVRLRNREQLAIMMSTKRFQLPSTQRYRCFTVRTECSTRINSPSLTTASRIPTIFDAKSPRSR